MSKEITPIVNSPQEVVLLTKGWIHLVFKEVTDAQKVKQNIWMIGSTLILFNFHTLFFDAKLERMDTMLILVCLLGLHPHY